MNRNALLQSIPLFQQLSAQDLQILARSMTLCHYDAGETIFDQGDVGNTMYIVTKGCVHIYVHGDVSQSIPVKDLTRGEYFGELSLIDDKVRSAGACAETDVELLGLTRATLANYIETHPHVAMTILRTMSERLRETNLLLSQRASKNVDEEMEKNLSWSDRLADRVAELNGSWMFIISLGVMTGLWMLINSFAGVGFDPYPYVFFNLLLAIIVSLQGPLIVMSQNRKAIRDRIRSEADYRVNLKNEVNIEVILREVQLFRSEANNRLQLLEIEVEGLRDTFDTLE
jgi:CRP/FNR family transcriptional regulator, cyclic AMP receptor protein